MRDHARRRVKCWGDNEFGQLGDGTTNSATAPVDVKGLTSGVACVAAGELHTCALTTSGAVKCWGAVGIGGAILGGLFGAGSSGWGPTPVDIPGLSSGVVGIASGEFDTCAMLADGGVQCWGPGGEVELDPTTSYGATPQSVPGVPAGVTAIQIADGFGCLLTKSGEVRCWGGNHYGQLGDGTVASSAAPVLVQGLGSGVTWLSANGGTSACAILAGDHLKCWGQVPNQTQSATPVDVQGLTGPVRSVSMGGEAYGCAILEDSSVQCWPSGVDGTGGPTPVGVTNAAYVAANEECSCALLTSGKVECWYSEGLGPTAGSDELGDAGVSIATTQGSCLGDGKEPTGANTAPVEVLGF
jgi:alpha-tubulin suppressor-like RCC1 family protein